jgi:hypothetical protein
MRRERLDGPKQPGPEQGPSVLGRTHETARSSELTPFAVRKWAVRILGRKTERVTCAQTNPYCSENIIKLMTLRRVRWVVNAACIRSMRNSCIILVGKRPEKTAHVSRRCAREDSAKMGLKGVR